MNGECRCYDEGDARGNASFFHSVSVCLGRAFGSRNFLFLAICTLSLDHVGGAARLSPRGGLLSGFSISRDAYMAYSISTRARASGGPLGQCAFALPCF